jgi:glycosyltransferase involved in cell wall biosynthesis
MPGKPLHIAWLGPAPGEDGGVPGVASDLLHGLAALGHRIDCFFPAAKANVPTRLAEQANITITWGTMEWHWDRWYSRARIAAFVSGLLARSLALLRLRRLILDAHRRDPYDVIYQFSSIESVAVPPALMRTVPLVIHPETHSAGELRSLIAERKLSLACQSRRRFALVMGIMLVRSIVQRARIRRAALLVCISSVFRDHMVRDYGYPLGATVVVPNPVRVERFQQRSTPPPPQPVVVVLGRVVARKGIDSVVALAKTLLERDVRVKIRIVGGPSLWSDYTRLLEDLPEENAEYVGSVTAGEIPGELAASDVLLQASSYEPFALTVAEALAAGVPVLATSEVGAIENVDRSVAVSVPPGDVDAMADALVKLLERLADAPAELHALARAEAKRLFTPEVVCAQISAALEGLLERA